MTTSQTMKEAIVYKDVKVKIVDSPIPTPGPDQVVIKVAVSGSNPKDWKIASWLNLEINSGDDIAGTIHTVGTNVFEFRPGDRVASFHEMRTPGGSFAEYAVGYAHTTFHLPPSTSFEDGAAVPLAAMTAALGLFVRLGLPQPWGTRSGEKVEERRATPLLVYGGASAVGAYAIKFATKANLHPIIAVAGRGKDFVEGLIDREKGDTIVDYRDGDEAVVEGIRTALSGQKLSYAFDAVSEKGSYGNIVQVLDPHGHITFVLPGRTYEGIPDTVKQTVTTVGDSHENEKDFAYVYFRYIARGLAEGWFKPHPVEVVPGGLAGVQTGLEGLRDGRASARKYVFRIAETPGLGGK